MQKNTTVNISIVRMVHRLNVSALSHLARFAFAPKQMSCSESICIFPWALFVFTMHYCKVGQSTHTHTHTHGFPYTLYFTILPHVCRSRFALWDGIMTTSTTTK